MKHSEAGRETTRESKIRTREREKNNKRLLVRMIESQPVRVRERGSQRQVGRQTDRFVTFIVIERSLSVNYSK